MEMKLTDAKKVRAILTRHSKPEVPPESSVFFMDLCKTTILA